MRRTGVVLGEGVENRINRHVTSLENQVKEDNRISSYEMPHVAVQCAKQL